MINNIIDLDNYRRLDVKNAIVLLGNTFELPVRSPSSPKSVNIV